MPRERFEEGVEKSEKPLLLDPSSAFVVRDHFAWTVDAHMIDKSPRGYATIVTCGLNRQELRALRLKVAIKTREAVKNVVDAFRRRDREAMNRELRGIAELGSRTSEFTSMVRWLVEEGLHRPWRDLGLAE